MVAPAMGRCYVAVRSCDLGQGSNSTQDQSNRTLHRVASSSAASSCDICPRRPWITASFVGQRESYVPVDSVESGDSDGYYR